jgi:two-component sensor histidine kinase
MLKPFRYHIIILIALLVGAVVLQDILNSHYRSIENDYEERLREVHSSAMVRAKAAIDVYAAITSSLRSHIENSKEFPTEIELQKFLIDLLKELEFNDLITVTYLNKNHEFIYVFSPEGIDEAGIKGMNVSDFRPKEEIEELDKLMKSDSIRLFEPINLYEGWAGFPFNFAISNNNNEVIGYMAALINVKYLLDYFYLPDESEFVHYFEIDDKFFISREVVYSGTPVLNEKRDPEYFKNFPVKFENYITSTLNLFGLKLTVGSAFKKQPKVKSNLALIVYLWYLGLFMYFIISLIQFYRNYKLNKQLKMAQGVIEQKNIKLQKRIDQVQTLIQEIHHRVKNNMLMVTTLLDMQNEEYQDKKVKKALEQCKGRIQSMSLIHEKLYGSENHVDIIVKDYIDQLIDYIELGIKYTTVEIQKEVKIPSDLIFDGETMVPLGLILNELITNSYKYAFRPSRKNLLKIEIVKTQSGFELFYSDNGPGIPDSVDFKNSSSLGLKLVMLLAEELHGDVTYKKDDFSRFDITFKPKSSAK